jgi:hypothetical protein
MYMAEQFSHWFDKLTAGLNSLAEELGLDDMATSRMRDFVVGIAKEQYKAGNRAGIRWARSGTSARPAQT